MLLLVEDRDVLVLIALLGRERIALMATGDGLSVSEVTVQFGGLTALDAVSLRVDPGEVVGVIGPNGAGKTTLFNVICGFVRPSRGHLEYRGESITLYTAAGLRLLVTLFMPSRSAKRAGPRG